MFDLSRNKMGREHSLPTKIKLTKKQQAIADREVELVQLAKTIVEEQGFTNLTMDRLTALSAYSKGTIYNHFCSKEDVIIALCIDGIKKKKQRCYFEV